MEVKDPVLDIQDVSIKFGDFKAIKDVSTSVGKMRSGFSSDRTERERRRFSMRSAERIKSQTDISFPQ